MKVREMERRHVVIGGAAVVAVTAFAASADTLATLGKAVGWKGELSWSLPVAVDVLALVALVAWFTPGVRRLGQWMTGGSVVTSVILNALGHLVSTGHLKVGPEMVIGVSAVPVISMALAAHLAVEVTRPEDDQHGATSTDDHQAVTEDDHQAVPEVTAPVLPVVTPDDHQAVMFPAPGGDHLVTAPVTAAPPLPVTSDGWQMTAQEPSAVTDDDHQAVPEVTAPVTAAASGGDRRMVTEMVTADDRTGTAEVTAAVRRKAERMTADQGGRVTIDQLRELGLSRRTATALRRELVTA